MQGQRQHPDCSCGEIKTRMEKLTSFLGTGVGFLRPLMSLEAEITFSGVLKHQKTRVQFVDLEKAKEAKLVRGKVAALSFTFKAVRQHSPQKPPKNPKTYSQSWCSPRCETCFWCLHLWRNTTQWKTGCFMMPFHFNPLKSLSPGFIRWLSAALICVTKGKKGPAVGKQLTGSLDGD